MAQAPRNVVYEGLFNKRKELSNGFRIEIAISRSSTDIHHYATQRIGGPRALSSGTNSGLTASTLALASRILSQSEQASS